MDVADDKSEPMSLTAKLLKTAWRMNRAERMVRNPGRYAKQRTKSKAMSSAGVWRLWRRWWRL